MRALIMIITIANLIFASIQVVQASPATQWSLGHKSKARLIVGTITAANGLVDLYAGVEIRLAPGWKTYWRHPGEAGGVPPYLDWSKSKNLAETKVLFPAPLRFKDAIGDAIGYKEHIVLPIFLKLNDFSRPADLALNFQYGVCREICIPAEAKLTLQITPSKIGMIPPQLVEALQRVPVANDAAFKNRPVVKRVELRVNGTKPALIIDAHFPLGLEGADVFIETSDELYLPMAKRLSQPMPDVLRYGINLTDGVDLKDLSGRNIRLTLVSNAISAEAEYTLP